MPETTTKLDINAAYRAHAHHVYRRAVRLLGREVDAMEVVQEIFASLIADPAQFEGRSALSTWLYRATTHRCLNRIRDEQTRGRLLSARAEVAPSASPGTQSEDVAELRALLVRLPTELARVAVYYYGDEMTQEEIASVLECSRHQVGSLLARLDREIASFEAAS